MIIEDISKLFIYVPAEYTSHFKLVAGNAEYIEKIAFLEGSGEIYTHGKSYGVDSSVIDKIKADLADIKAISTITPEELNESIEAALEGAKGYTDEKVSPISSAVTANTAAITTLTSSTTANTEAITKLNGGKEVEGSVDQKVASAVSTAIAQIVDAAPETFDTLREVAEWIDAHGVEALALADSISKVDAAEKSLEKRVYAIETVSVWGTFDPDLNLAEVEASTNATVITTTDDIATVSENVDNFAEKDGVEVDGITTKTFSTVAEYVVSE